MHNTCVRLYVLQDIDVAVQLKGSFQRDGERRAVGQPPDRMEQKYQDSLKFQQILGVNKREQETLRTR